MVGESGIFVPEDVAYVQAVSHPFTMSPEPCMESALTLLLPSVGWCRGYPCRGVPG